MQSLHCMMTEAARSCCRFVERFNKLLDHACSSDKPLQVRACPAPPPLLPAPPPLFLCTGFQSTDATVESPFRLCKSYRPNKRITQQGYQKEQKFWLQESKHIAKIKLRLLGSKGTARVTGQQTVTYKMQCTFVYGVVQQMSRTSSRPLLPKDRTCACTP